MKYEDIMKNAIGYTSYGDDYDEFGIDDYIKEEGVSYEEARKAVEGGDNNDIT